jgi:very-short-patch-repair endonuclease
MISADWTLGRPFRRDHQAPVDNHRGHRVDSGVMVGVPDDAWLDEVMPLVLPEEARLLTRADALRDVGPAAVRYRCRSGQWVRLAPAIYLTTPPVTWLDRLHSAHLHAGSGCAISGAAALVEYGFRVGRPGAVLVLVACDIAVRSQPGIRIRRTTRLPAARRCRGLPLAPVARAVADHVVGLRHLDQVQAIVAHAVQRKLCTVADLAVELDAGPRRGSRLFREALRDVGFGANSVPEARAGRLLRAAGVTGFVQNAEVRVGDRRLLADFLWPELRAVLEIDSTEFHLTPEDHDATLARDQLLQAAGYIVLHVKPSQLRDAEAFVALIRAWLVAVARRTTS